MLLTSTPLVGAEGTLEGRWLLVERTHGEGGLNLARGEPVGLVLSRDETGALTGQISVGSEPRRAFPWPGLPRPDSGLPVEVLERAERPGKGVVRTTYRLREEADGSRVLRIVETLQVGADGDSLAATWEITSFEAGEDGGTLILRGRFERRP
jgi:hypothetical protein